MGERRFEVEGTFMAVMLLGVISASGNGASCEDDESGNVKVARARCSAPCRTSARPGLEPYRLNYLMLWWMYVIVLHLPLP